MAAPGLDGIGQLIDQLPVSLDVFFGRQVVMRGALISDGPVADDNIARLQVGLQTPAPGHQEHALCTHDSQLFCQLHHHR
jgi:hypothetical protein